MTYVITDACTKSTSCIDVCPVDCIDGKDEDGSQLYINPETCIDCNLCVGACPNQAIFPAEEVPDRSRASIAVNYGHYGLDSPW